MWARVLLAVGFASLLSACVAPVQEHAAPLAAPKEDCRVTYVVDGDTVHLKCQGRPEVKARLLGFDTPEVYSPKCTAEQAAGQEATRQLRSLVRQGPVTRADFRGHDRYGRELVRLEIAGQDVARTMISMGLAASYSGGTHPNWCARL